MSRSVNASCCVRFTYHLHSVCSDLVARKINTLLTVLVIALSLTLPTTAYLIWKNVHSATETFYPKNELSVYLHNSLTEQDSHSVVEKIRQFEGVQSLNYISRQQSLTEFQNWIGLGQELALLDDNPLPAVVIITPVSTYSQTQLRTDLSKIKGVEEVRFEQDWLEKLNILTWLTAQIAVVCALLMVMAVFLVIGNSIRSDVYSQQANIEVTKLVGATDQFILRPFLYTGMIYSFLGGVIAVILSSVILAYFAHIMQYVNDVFTISFQLKSLTIAEILFLLILCTIMGYIAAWIAGKRYIALIDEKY